MAEKGNVYERSHVELQENTCAAVFFSKVGGCRLASLLKRESKGVCYYLVKYEFQSESTLYNLPECQGTLCSKQAPYLK